MLKIRLVEVCVSQILRTLSSDLKKLAQIGHDVGQRCGGTHGRAILLFSSRGPGLNPKDTLGSNLDYYVSDVGNPLAKGFELILIDRGGWG